MKKCILILLTTLFVSCTQDKIPTKTAQTQSFLKGQWILDSIVGQKDFIQEWLFFTDSNKFWRFSEYTEKYLLDKDLAWRSDTIYKNNKPIYFITKLDSSNIIIDDGTKRFHCEKWAEFDNEDIVEFIEADSMKKLIKGAWFVDSADTYPISIEPDCKNLTKGSKIVFNNSGRLEVFPHDTTFNHWCSNYICRIALDHVRYTSGCTMRALSIKKLNETELVMTGGFGIAGTVKFKRVK